MSIVATKLEYDILEACQAKDVEAFRKAFSTLQLKRSALPFERVSVSLYMLCCEEAIKLGAWEVAEICLSQLRSEEYLTQLLECRTLFCESRLRCNRIDDKDSQNTDWIQHRHACAVLAVQGIKIALRESPCETSLILEGADLLWSIVEPIYYSWNFSAALDVIIFLRSLYDRLGLGGNYTRLQWCMYHAICLRGLCLHQDAQPLINEAMEISNKLHDDRLHLQIQRFLSLTLAEKELFSSKSNKGDGNNVVNIKGLYQHTVHLTQLVMSGHIEMNASVYLDLMNLFERISASQRRMASDPLTESTTIVSSMLRTTSYSKGNKLSKSQQQLQITENDISDVHVQNEVLSNLVLCLVLYGGEEWSGRTNKILHQFSKSTCVRMQVLAILVEVVGLNARSRSIIQSTSIPPDAPFLRRSVQLDLLKRIRIVEKTLTITHTIPDSADRLYILNFVCFILWKLCLPLLQTEARVHLSGTLDRIIKALESDPNTFTPPYIVFLLYESSLAELHHGSLSLARIRAEKALLWSQRHYLYRNNARLGGVSPQSMDFALRWLRHCIEIGDGMTLNDSQTTLGEENRVLLSILQARRAKKGAKRVQFLKDAYAKLIALESINGRVAGEGDSAATGNLSNPITPRSLHGNLSSNPFGGRRLTRKNSKSLVSLVPESPPRRSLVELYAMLLHECYREMTPSLLGMMKTIAGALCGMQIYAEGRFPELVHLQAQAYLINAEIIALESAENAGNQEFKASDGAELLVQATNLDAACITRGASTGWVTVCACELFLEQYSTRFLFNDGGNRSMYQYLNELYHNYTQLSDLAHLGDSILYANLTLVYILSMTCEYIKSKGEVNDELSVETLDEYLVRLLSYPKVDASHPLIKKAFEVCQDVVQRVKEPSRKASLCMLFPCLSRLLGMPAKMDLTAPPQEQLLYLLGRASGPITKEEKLALLKKEIMELIAVDPAVQLCGRVAMLALELGQDPIIAEVFHLGNALYAKGKLAWSSQPPRPNLSTLSNLANFDNSIAAASTTIPQGDFPALPSQLFDTEALSASLSSTTSLPPTGSTQPNSEDWMWYARLLYCQAHAFYSRASQASLSIAKRLYESILPLCTNCAIAVSHAVEAFPRTRALLIEESLSLYYEALCRIGFGANYRPPAHLVPSLKIMLSKSILSFVLNAKEVQGREKGRWGQKTSGNLPQLLFQMSACLFRCHAWTRARVGEVVNALAYLRARLPLSFQKQLGLLEIVYASRVNPQPERRVSELLGGDSTTKALAWMALARPPLHRGVPRTAAVEGRDSTPAPSSPPSPAADWELALKHAQKFRPLRAQCLLEMVQSCLSVGKITLDQATTMLFTGLSLIEEEIEIRKRKGQTVASVPDAMPQQDFNKSLGDIYSLDWCLISCTNETTDSSKANSLKMNSSSQSTRSKRDSGYFASVFKARFLGIHILYALLTLSPQSVQRDSEPFPSFGASMDAFYNGRFHKLNVAVHLLKHVKFLWLNLMSVLVPQEGKLAWTVPNSFREWIYFECEESCCEAAKASPELDFSLNTETFQGILFEVADFLAEGIAPHFSFNLYQLIRFLAALRYGFKSLRTAAVWRAATAKLITAALRCGYPMQRESVVLLPTPASPYHLHEILKWIDKDSENAEGAAPFAEKEFNPSFEPQPTLVRWIPAKGSARDVLLNEAEVLSSLGRIDEAAVLADQILPFAKSGKDADGVRRCLLLKCALLEVGGDWQGALHILEQDEDGMSEVSPSVWARWQGERIRQLLCKAMDVGRAKALFSSLLQHAEAFSRLPGIGQEIAGQLRQNLHRKLLESLLEMMSCRGLGEAQRELSASFLELISEALGQSRDVKDRMLALVSDVLRRREITAAEGYASMSESTISKLFQDLVREAQACEVLLEEVRAELKEFDVNSPSNSGHQCLCPPHRAIENRLLGLLATNYAARSQLADEVLFRYQNLTLEELALPRGEVEGIDMEKAVMEYYRDPTAIRGGAHRLAKDWQEASYEQGWPLELVHAFQHFGIPVEGELGKFASRYKTRDILRSARDILPEGGGVNDRQTCFLSLQWEWRRALELLALEESSGRPLSRSFTTTPTTSTTNIPTDPGLGRQSPREEWSSTLQGALQRIWAATPLTTVVEKHTSGRHNETRSRKETKVDFSNQEIFTDEMVDILEMATRIVNDAQYQLDFKMLSKTFTLVALFLSVWGFPHRAACAVELALAAKNAHSVLQFYHLIMLESDTLEARLWNTLQRIMQTNESLAVYSHEFFQIREELLSTSAVLYNSILAKPAINLVLDDGGSMTNPTLNTITDGVCLTILLASEEPYGGGVSYGIPSTLSMFFVVLHHPDGNVNARLRYADAKVLKELAVELKEIKESMREAMSLKETKATISMPRDSSYLTKVFSDFLLRLEKALLPLVEVFEPSLSILCVKNTLYLCLDPIFQPLPVEHVNFFTKFSVVSRELNVWSVMKKNGQRALKSSSTPALQVIDPFADHPASISLFTTTEHGPSKAQTDLLSCTQERHPLQPSFLKYKLRSTAYNTLVFNGCGPFTAVFTPMVLATAQLRQMQNMILFFDSITPSSQRREQLSRQAHQTSSISSSPSSLWAINSKHFSQEVEMWEVLLFLLACGVRFIATTWCPSLPDENDILCKKMVGALLPGRGTGSENFGGSKTHKDSKREIRIIHYGGRGAATRNR